MTTTPTDSHGTLIRLLLQMHKITPEQVEHAARIQAKLTAFRPLLKILKEKLF